MLHLIVFFAQALLLLCEVIIVATLFIAGGCFIVSLGIKSFHWLRRHSQE